MQNKEDQFNTEEQRLLISYMLSSPTDFIISQGIIKADYFNSTFKKTIEYILDYSDEFKATPTIMQVEAMTNHRFAVFDELSPSLSEWYLKTVEEFCRYKALENAVLDGVDLLQKGQGGDLERRVRDAMTICLNSNLGTSYFDNPAERLSRLRDKSNMVSTGWKSLDEKLYGGFTKGGLNIFCGCSGSGKSVVLQNLANNWAKAGLNTIYFTLELSEDLTSVRIDSMNTGLPTKGITSHALEVETALKRIRPTAGDLIIKKLPESGTTTNHLRAFIKEYTIKTGKKVHAIVVDYLDLMYPNNSKIDLSSLFTKDKYVAEEVRAMMGEFDAVGATACQFNRGAVEAREYDHSHIAGGISKINTADNAFGILALPQMKEKGEYVFQFLKTRSSAAVGQEIRMGYNPDCLVLSDHPTWIISQRDRPVVSDAAPSSPQSGAMKSLPIKPGGSKPSTIFDDLMSKNKSLRK